MRKPLRSRTLEELNPVAVKRDCGRVGGILLAANILNEWQEFSRNGYAIGEILLFKLNLLKGGKRAMRKVNPCQLPK